MKKRGPKSREARAMKKRRLTTIEARAIVTPLRRSASEMSDDAETLGAREEFGPSPARHACPRHACRRR
jgi:hypothetical protein